jgi:ribosomal protein L37AE/L43A
VIQRLYRAACPNCGAPVEFRSAASAIAVCSFCKSTIARSGDALERIGKMAELFDDHSPLQLGASGRDPRATGAGAAGFSLIGRLQYRYAEGTWNEWHLLFDEGSQAWLSEDNGRYALGRDVGPRPDAPAAQSLQAGQRIRIDDASYEISSVIQAQLIAAAGELPFAPPLNQPFWLVDARSADGRIGTLDYSVAGATRWSVGRPVSLADLAMQGLRDESGKTLAARSFGCPHCGAPIDVKLSDTRSITCPACASVIDLSQGLGGELVHFQQAHRFASPIPLGTVGRFDGVQWQAVGFARRQGVDQEGERFAWSEVLLYNSLAGFAFVVVASDGISLVRTVQDSPAPIPQGVRYQDRIFRPESPYVAVVEYVEGEFYWQVQAGQKTRNIDYRSAEFVLSREEGAGEVVWSYGVLLEEPAIAGAFGLSSLPIAAAAGALAAAPIAASGALDQAFGGGGGLPPAPLHASSGSSPISGSLGVWGLIIIVVIILVVVFALMGEDEGGGSGYRGGYGGSSGFSGGAHK